MVIGQLCGPATSLGKELPVLTELVTGWTPKLIWNLWRREKICPCVIF